MFFCSTLHGLSNAVYRFSMRCVVLEISGGGLKSTPPAGSRLAQTPAGARVKTAPMAAILVNPYFRSKSAEHDVTLTSFVAEL